MRGVLGLKPRGKYVYWSGSDVRAHKWLAGLVAYLVLHMFCKGIDTYNVDGLEASEMSANRFSVAYVTGTCNRTPRLTTRQWWHL